MTLLQMRYFIETNNAGSTQKAAEKLNVSQSAISVAIRSMEKELGVVLFQRTPRGLFLNEAGREFLAKGKDILDQFDQLVDEMQKYSFTKKQIRIGMPPLLSLSYWPDFFCQLSQSRLENSFEIVSETRQVLLKMLKDGWIDFLILPSQNPEQEFIDLQYRFLLTINDPPSVTMSIENPLAAHETLSYAELVHEPLLGYKKGELKTERLRKVYASYGVELQYVQQCEYISVLIELLKKNIGIAYLNERVVRDCEELVCIPISGAVRNGDFYLIYNEEMPEKLCRKVADAFIKSMDDLSNENYN